MLVRNFSNLSGNGRGQIVSRVLGIQKLKNHPVIGYLPIVMRVFFLVVTLNFSER